MVILRQYQKDAISAVPNTAGKHLLVLPAGAGKSLIIKALSSENTTIVCHRNILLEQLKNRGCLGRIVSRQRLYSTPDHQPIINKRTLIIDECHSINDVGQYNSIINRYDRIIGLTATPYRLDCGHISKLGWNTAYEVTEKELIDDGYLVPITYKDVPLDLLMNIESVDYNDNKKLVRKAKSYIDKHTDYIKENINLNVPTLIFGSSISHCNMIVDKLGTGIAYHSKLSVKAREKILANKPNVLVSVETLNIGFDWPACQQVLNLRPTTSYSLYHQLSRRVSRLHPTKKEGIIYDFTYNRFDFDDKDNDFNTLCIFCGTLTDRRLNKCTSCSEPVIRESREIKSKICMNGHPQLGKSNYCNVCGVQTYEAKYKSVELDSMKVLYSDKIYIGFGESNLFKRESFSKEKGTALIKKLRKDMPILQLQQGNNILPTNKYTVIYEDMITKNKIIDISVNNS